MRRFFTIFCLIAAQLYTAPGGFASAELANDKECAHQTQKEISLMEYILSFVLNLNLPPQSDTAYWKARDDDYGWDFILDSFVDD